LEASIDGGGFIVADARGDVEAQKRLGNCEPEHRGIPEKGMVSGCPI
jgi:hypothetical protein